MKLPRLTFILPYAAVFSVGVSLYAAVSIALAVRDDLRLTVLVAACSAGAAAVYGLSAVAAAQQFPLAKACRLAATPTLLFVTGYGMFLLVERDVTRAIGAVALMGLIGAFLLTIEGSGGVLPRYSHQDLAHLALVLHAVTVFCGLVFFFGLPTFSSLHPAGAAVLAGLLVGAMAHETFWHDGFATEKTRPVVLAFALLGAEFYAVLSLLPVLPVVSAAFALTLFVPALTVSAMALRGARAPRALLFLALLLAVIILASARWN